jgi:hypothetical protein
MLELVLSHCQYDSMPEPDTAPAASSKTGIVEKALSQAAPPSQAVPPSNKQSKIPPPSKKQVLPSLDERLILEIGYIFKENNEMMNRNEERRLQRTIKCYLVDILNEILATAHFDGLLLRQVRFLPGVGRQRGCAS